MAARHRLCTLLIRSVRSEPRYSTGFEACSPCPTSHGDLERRAFCRNHCFIAQTFKDCRCPRNQLSSLSLRGSKFSSSSLLDEREFHKLADELLHYLQEKFDALGEECDIDGFDIDYAEGVLTLKLGPSGTYVINKQTPNRQIWLSSPVSGPARFDWDTKEHCWVYRRTKAEIFHLLEKEVHDLVGASIALSK